MKRKHCIFNLYRLAITAGLSFIAYKLVRHWHAGYAQKTGDTIDVSIHAAAENIEKAALAVEEWADSSVGASMGKGIDKVLMDAKKKLDKATSLVEHALNFAK